jgi:hypothetical protein
VDADGNGVIELSEFKAFWAAVSKKNSDKDILEELENIKNGDTWVGFSNMPKAGTK